MSDTRTLKIVVSGDSSGGKRALREIGSEATSTTSKFDKTGAALAGFATKGAVALGAVGVGAAALGIKTASGMEQAKIAFTNMLGSGQKADVFLLDLEKFAASTPFEFPDLVRSAQQLMAMGIKAKDVKPMLTAVGDAVAGMGGSAENVQRVTRAFGQMQAKGKVAGDELLQLTEQGIPAIRILADGYGVTTYQMNKMVAKGQVLSDKALPMLVKGLESGTKSVKGFGGMMDQQSRSAQGRWSTLVDTVQMGLGRLALKAFPVMNQAMIGVTAGFTSMITAFNTGGGGKATGMVGMFQSVGLAGRTFSAWIRTDGVPLVGKLMAIFKAEADVIGPVLGAAFAGLLVTVKTLWGVYTGIINVMSQHLPVVRVLTGLVIAYYGAVGIMTTVTKAAAASQYLQYQMALLSNGGLKAWIVTTNIGKIATYAWTAAQWLFNGAMAVATAPITLVIAAIALLAGGIYLIATKTTWFQTIWEYMSGALVTAWHAIAAAASWVWNTVLLPVFGFIGKGIGILVAVFQAWWFAVSLAIKAVATVASWLWTSVLMPVFNFIGAAIEVMKAVFILLAFVISVQFRAIAAIAQWVWTTILQPVFGWIGMGVRILWAVFQEGARIIGLVFTGIGNVASWLWTTVLTPVFGWIKLGFRVLWAVFQEGARLIGLVFSGIGKAASWVWTAVLTPVFSWIKTGFRILWAVFQEGARIIGVVFSGIGTAIRWVWDHSIANVFGWLKTGVDAVRGAFKTAVDAIGKAWTTMKDLVSKPIYAVLNFVGQNLSKPINSFLRTIGAGALAHLPEWKYAEGGVLPGYTPGRDVHHFTSPTGGRLALSGGEGIMVPEFTRSVGGASGIARLNAIARHGGAFAGGGVWQSMASWIQKTVPGSQISSAFRAGGSSYHGQGSAIDVVPPSMKVFSTIASNWGKAIKELIYTPAGPLAIKNGEQVGMDWYGPAVKAAHYSHVHWAMSPLGMGVPGGGGIQIPNIWAILGKVKGIIGNLKNIGGGMWGKALSAGQFGGNVMGALKNKITGWFSSLFSSGGGGGGSFSANKNVAANMLRAMGWNMAEMTPLDKLWTKESGWRVNAKNPTSGAYGIPQSLPASKMASAGKDWMTNATTQIRWGLNYIRDTYGSPAAAWAHSVRTGWYDDEGVLPPGRTVAMNGTGRNEYVSKTPPGGGGITVSVTVMGSVTTERDLVKTITLGVRDELRRHADRNGGRTGL